MVNQGIDFFPAVYGIYALGNLVLALSPIPHATNPSSSLAIYRMNNWSVGVNGEDCGSQSYLG